MTVNFLFRLISWIRTKCGIFSLCRALLIAEWISSTGQDALGFLASRTKVKRLCSAFRFLAGATVVGAAWRVIGVFFLWTVVQPPVSRKWGVAAIAAYNTPWVWLGVSRGGRPPAGTLSAVLFPGLSLVLGAGGAAAALSFGWGAGAEAGVGRVDTGAKAHGFLPRHASTSTVDSGTRPLACC